MFSPLLSRFAAACKTIFVPKWDRSQSCKMSLLHQAKHFASGPAMSECWGRCPHTAWDSPAGIFPLYVLPTHELAAVRRVCILGRRESSSLAATAATG